METTERDPWFFQRWARTQKLGNPTRKLILQSLAITAESQTGSGFAMQADLAEHAECSVRTVSTHLQTLEDAGLIVRRRRFSKNGRRIADGFLLLAPGVTEWPDGEPATQPAGSAGGAPPATSASGSPVQSPPEAQVAGQELPLGTTQERDEGAQAPATDRRDQVPDDFPHELRPHARQVLLILRTVAADHGARKVWAKSLAVTMMSHPHRRYVAVARDLQAWAVDPRRPIKDVVATYRTFLQRAEVIEGVERLDEHGNPATAPAMNGHGRGGGRPMSNADRVDANVAALDAWAAAEASDTVGRT